MTLRLLVYYLCVGIGTLQEQDNHTAGYRHITEKHEKTMPKSTLPLSKSKLPLSKICMLSDIVAIASE